MSPQRATVCGESFPGNECFLRFSLKGQEDGGEKAHVGSQGFLLIALSGESCRTPVLHGTPTRVGYELHREKGETVLAMSLDCDLLPSAIASALQGFNLSSYSLSQS